MKIFDYMILQLHGKDNDIKLSYLKLYPEISNYKDNI